MHIWSWTCYIISVPSGGLVANHNRNQWITNTLGWRKFTINNHQTAAQLRLLCKPPHRRPTLIPFQTYPPHAKMDPDSPAVLRFLVASPRRRPHCQLPRRVGRRGPRWDWRRRGQCWGGFLAPMFTGHPRKWTLNPLGCLRSGRPTMRVFSTPTPRSRSCWRWISVNLAMSLPLVLEWTLYLIYWY
jgi:hypothetical protein